MGAYLQLVTPGIPLLGAWIYAGPYAIPNYSVEFTGVFTNTTPTDAYRGAGRPEATYVIERTIDALADELGMDRVELRRKNFIKEFPATIGSGLTIDSGDYVASLDKLLDHLDLDALRAEQAKRRENGTRAARRRLLDLHRDVRARAVAHPRGDPLRRRRLGAGHDAVPPDRLGAGRHRDVAARAGTRDRLGADRRRPARLRHGRRRGAPRRHCGLAAGLDTYGSRSLPVGGVALCYAADKVIDKARQIVAHQLEVSADDLEYAHGTFAVKGSPDKEMTLAAAAWAAFAAHDLPDGMEPGLEAHGDVRPAELLLAGRRACGGRRGRHRDRRRAARPLRGDRRRRHGRQPADRRRPGARRHHAGDLAGALRGGLYDEDGQAPDRQPRHVPRAVGGRAAVVRARPDREARARPTRSESREWGRPGRSRGPCRDQRGARCGVSPRSQGHPDAGHARTCLARDQEAKE